MKIRWLAVPIALALAGTPLVAQTASRVGFIFQVPVATGIIWQASETFALRPEVSYSTFTSGSVTQSTWALAINAPIYLSNRDNIRPYLTPRLGYSKATTSGSASSGTSTTVWSGAGSFGAQYAPTARFNVYGETGVGYASSTASGINVNSHTWAPRSAIGLILYFGK